MYEYEEEFAFCFWCCCCRWYSLPAAAAAAAADTGITTTTDNDPAPTAASALTVASKVSVVDAKSSGSAAAVAPLHIRLFKVAARGALLIRRTINSTGHRSGCPNVPQRQFNDNKQYSLYDVAKQRRCHAEQGRLCRPWWMRHICDSSNRMHPARASLHNRTSRRARTCPSYMKFTVNSSRVDNNSPEIVKVWIHQERERS